MAENGTSGRSGVSTPVNPGNLPEDINRLIILLRGQQSDTESPLNKTNVSQILRILENRMFKNLQEAYLEVAKTVPSSHDDQKEAEEVAQKTIAVFNASQGILQPRMVEIPKVGTSLGFNIMGGNEIGVPIYISKILPGGITERTGGLRRGDQLLAVNGETVSDKSHEDVVRLLKIADGTVKLIVHYSPDLLDRMENEFETSRRQSSRRASDRPSTSSRH